MEAPSDTLTFLASLPALIIIVLAALTMLLTSDWRLSLTALLVEYLALGLLLTRSVPIAVVIAKILTGVFVVFMLYLTARRVQDAKAPPSAEFDRPRLLGLPLGWGSGPLGLPLRLLAVLLASLALVPVFGNYRLTLVPADIAFIACWLGVMGLLGLVLSGELLRMAPALLTILIGFDLVYSRLEPNLAIAGFFAAFTLLATLAFSYLITIQGLAEAGTGEEEEVPS
jgi:hypothetical protein